MALAGGATGSLTPAEFPRVSMSLPGGVAGWVGQTLTKQNFQTCSNFRVRFWETFWGQQFGPFSAIPGALVVSWQKTHPLPNACEFQVQTGMTTIETVV